MPRKAPRLPLAGFRVVELAHHLSAPLAGMYLADFGADVVKVEAPEGEDWRRWGRPSPAPNLSQLFLAINRNKRSLALDLSRPEGRPVLERLLGSADALLTNYAPPALGELGLDPRRLRRRHPRLVVCTLAGFGARGPQAGRRAFDIVVCGETGLLLPHPGGAPPLVNAAPMTDTGGSLMLALGITLALLHRERGGRGQIVETALANVAVALQAHRFIWLDGEAAPELSVPSMTLYGCYATKDGFITIAVLAERLWRRLCRALGLERVLDDPRYTPWANLVARQLELRPEIEARFGARTTDAWLETLVAAGVPAGRVSWGAQVFEHPQLVANGAIMRTRHPRAGGMRMMGFPLRLGSTPARLRRPAPVLGAHTRRVLSELGYRRAEIARLGAAGIVRGA